MALRRHPPPQGVTGDAASRSHGGHEMSSTQHYLGIVAFVAVVLTVIMLPPLRRNKQLSTDNMLAGGHPRVEKNAQQWERIQKVLEERERSEVLHEDDKDEQQKEQATASSTAKRKIDLTMYVIFHRQLLSKMYEGIDWSQVDVPMYLGGTQTNGFRRAARNTLELTAALSGIEIGANRTTIVFVGANKFIKKHYERPLTEGRLLLEWELPGYDSRIGSQLNEYGVMNSIFASQLTQHAGNIANVAGRATNAKLVAADADGDGVQEWIGVFQYDMPLDTSLIHDIRRRIERRTNNPNPSATDSTTAPPGSTTRPLLHCCIFYGFSFPTRSLLGNELGRQLLIEYNQYFGTQHALRDLPRVSILDAFVVPNIVFNHFAPFLEYVMLRFLRNNSVYTIVNSVTSPPSTTAIPHVMQQLLAQEGVVDAMEEPATNGVGGDNSSIANTDSIPNADTNSTKQPAMQAARRKGGGKLKHKYPILTVEERKKGNTVMEAALAMALGFETNFVQVQLPLRHATWKL